jgi:hypothetical protein
MSSLDSTTDSNNNNSDHAESASSKDAYLPNWVIKMRAKIHESREAHGKSSKLFAIVLSSA